MGRGIWLSSQDNDGNIKTTKGVRECCFGGGQIMIRKSKNMEVYDISQQTSY